MGQPDPAQVGGSKDPRRKLGWIGIRSTSGLMMHIVKFAHCGEPSLLHFHEHQCRNCLNIVGGQAVQKPVHQIAPCPKTIPPSRAMFGHSGHRPLKRMTVQVRKCRQHGRHATVARLWGAVGQDLGNTATRHVNSDIPGPSIAQQGLCRENHLSLPYV